MYLITSHERVEYNLSINKKIYHEFYLGPLRI